MEFEIVDIVDKGQIVSVILELEDGKNITVNYPVNSFNEMSEEELIRELTRVVKRREVDTDKLSNIRERLKKKKIRIE